MSIRNRVSSADIGCIEPQSGSTTDEKGGTSLVYRENDAGGTRRNAATCSDSAGQLPSCGALAFPYVAVQGKDPVRYDDQEALRQGTLFPGLDLPFHSELRSRFPQVDGALLELMALDFAIDELGLYLTTHSDDQQALELYWSYIRLGQEGRKKYQSSAGR